MSTAWRVVLLIAAFVVVFIFGGVIGGSTVVLFNRSHFEEVRAQRDKAQAQRMLERQKEAAEAARQIALLRQQVSQLQQQNHGGPQMLARRGPVAPEQFGPHLMQSFANRLELTADQQQQVHALVFQTAEDLRRLSRDTGHTSQVAIEHLEDQISALLTPAQRDRFNEMIQRGRENFQRWNEQQQQWRARQRLEQQGWRQNGRQGQDPRSGPGQPAVPAKPAPAPANSAPATPSAPGSTPSTPSTASPPAPAAQP